MNFESFFDLPPYVYSSMRSGAYFAEFGLLNSMIALLPNQKQSQKVSLETITASRKALSQLLMQDAAQIRKGTYPLSVLKPESPLRHLYRIPALARDGWGIAHRRKNRQVKMFNPKVNRLLEELPAYYRRNFHFQTDGYLSKRSARLYEHQTEMLFWGGGHAMRRMIIPPLKNRFKKNPRGKGLKFLEVGAGVGTATQFVQLAFPEAKIFAIDLSSIYLEEAKKRSPASIEYIQGNGEDLPFKDQFFDAVFSVFLFHELPIEARKNVLKEARRVLKTNGVLGFVDSIQKDDVPVLNEAIQNFPKNYYEPYYLNYINTPMEKLLSAIRLKKVQSQVGFVSKVAWGTK